MTPVAHMQLLAHSLLLRMQLASASDQVHKLTMSAIDNLGNMQRSTERTGIPKKYVAP